MSSELRIEDVTSRSDSYFEFASRLFLEAMPTISDATPVLGDGYHLYAATSGLYFVGAANANIDPNADYAYVWQLAVRPGHRNRGIGSALLGHVIGRAQAVGCQEIGISATSNDNARLYDRFGFRHDPRRTTEPERWRLFLTISG